MQVWTGAWEARRAQYRPSYPLIKIPSKALLMTPQFHQTSFYRTRRGRGGTSKRQPSGNLQWRDIVSHRDNSQRARCRRHLRWISKSISSKSWLSAFLRPSRRAGDIRQWLSHHQPRDIGPPSRSTPQQGFQSLEQHGRRFRNVVFSAWGNTRSRERCQLDRVFRKQTCWGGFAHLVAKTSVTPPSIVTLIAFYSSLTNLLHSLTRACRRQSLSEVSLNNLPTLVRLLWRRKRAGMSNRNCSPSHKLCRCH